MTETEKHNFEILKKTNWALLTHMDFLFLIALVEKLNQENKNCPYENFHRTRKQ
jgi:hypothetical protein